MLDTVAPLSKDCGMLCSGACCKDGESERKGMLLFPFEEKVLNIRDMKLSNQSGSMAIKMHTYSTATEPATEN